MLRPTAILKRSLIFVHRWLGVALSVIFLLWFVSGIVMMYWSFPEVTAEDRLQRAPVLDPARIQLSAEQAAALLGRDEPPAQVAADQLRRPSRLSLRRRWTWRRAAVAAVPRWSTPTMAASRSAVDGADDRSRGGRLGRAAAERGDEDPVEEVDQWTVGGLLRSLRPLYKYSWPDGQQVYVNGNTAEVVQYTTTASRFWAYLGAIPHWLYFTPLRKHQPEWFSFVVWSSLIGTLSRADRGRHCRLDVLAAEALSLCGRAHQHSVSRLEALAHDRRSVLRRGHDHVGVQRAAVDGAVSDHRPADRPDGSRRRRSDRGGAGGGRRPWRAGRRARRAARQRAARACPSYADEASARGDCVGAGLRREGARVHVVCRRAGLPRLERPRRDAHHSGRRRAAERVRPTTIMRVVREAVGNGLAELRIMTSTTPTTSIGAASGRCR